MRNKYCYVQFNRHHLLFSQKKWMSNKYAKTLRRVFVYEVPITVHNDYHLAHKDIPMPSIDVLKDVYNKYCMDWVLVERMDIIEACDWLIENVDDLDFKKAMVQQRNFFLIRRPI